MAEVKRVLVAMSGGVDSSMAAAILLQQGYQVEGMTMRLWREATTKDVERQDEEPSERARSVCRALSIVHHEIDLRDVFYQQVVRHFMNEYARGRTPNPCLRCNRLLKFGTLLDAARQIGCAALATGHYARVTHGETGWHLLCATDLRKDQSYFLYALGQQDLGSVLFPLGTWTKTQVRETAKAWGVPVAEQAESQDICFLGHGDYRRFLAQHMEETLKTGPIHDRQNRLLGQHRGLAFYTIGQREGLGIAASRPYYVLALDRSRNALVVGHAEELGHTALLADDMCYVRREALPQGFRVEAKIRYRARRAIGRLWKMPGERARVVFEQPLRDIAPGQAIVLYDGPEVLGGGIIAASLDQVDTEVDSTHATN